MGSLLRWALLSAIVACSPSVKGAPKDAGPVRIMGISQLDGECMGIYTGKLDVSDYTSMTWTYRGKACSPQQLFQILLDGTPRY